jgi:putative transposase
MLSPLIEHGIEKFMQRLGNGYTKYFNIKNQRSGVLFQGKFKSKHVNSNEYLLHLSAYVNTNNQLGHRMSKLSKSSLEEYINPSLRGLCVKNIILEQFTKPVEYKKFIDSSRKDIEMRKNIEQGIPI